MAVNWVGGRKHLPEQLRQRYCYRQPVQANHGIASKAQSYHQSSHPDSDNLSFNSDQVSEIDTVDKEDLEIVRRRILGCPNWSAIGARKAPITVSRTSSSRSGTKCTKEPGELVPHKDLSNVSWIVRKGDQLKSKEGEISDKDDTGHDLFVLSSSPTTAAKECDVVTAPRVVMEENEPAAGTLTKQLNDVVEDAAALIARTDLVASRQWLYNTLYQPNT